MLSGDSRTEPPQPVTMNPFDAVTAPATQPPINIPSNTISAPPLPVVGTSVNAKDTISCFQDSRDGGAFLNTTPGLMNPTSPSRVNRPSSVNNSPVPTRHPMNTLEGMSSPTQVNFTMASKPGAPEMPGLQETDGVLLGLQQLERQQAELERRRQVQPSAPSTPTTRPPTQRLQPASEEAIHMAIPGFSDPSAPSSGDSFVDDDDENTEPSSTGNVSENREGVMVSSQVSQPSSSSTFGRLIQNTKLRLINAMGHERPADADEEPDMPDGALIAGYLQKLGRNGKWQKRWFETDGESLSYYKTNQRVKMLATLDLEKVGRIAMSETDPSGCAFSIQVSGRPYHLRADSKASCKDWVISLNRVKEARMQQGNVKLITHPPPRDFLDRMESDDYSARIVVVANRQRTRAVDQESWEEVVGVGTNPATDNQSSAMTSLSPFSPHPRLTQVVFASWKKRRSVFSSMATKLLRWARSLRTLTCTDIEDEPVLLDHHVHPPGHDETEIRLKRSGNSITGTGKDSSSDSSKRPDMSPSSNHSIASTTTSDPRELA